MFIFQFLTVIGAAGLLCCIGNLIALHILPTGFHPIHDPVSNYAVSHYGFLFRLQVLSSSISGACLLALFAVANNVLPFWGIAALICYSLSGMLIIFFSTDVKPPRTLKGNIHIILAIFRFTGIAFATAILTSPLTNLTTWSKMRSELHATAVLTYVAAIVFLVVFTIRPFRQIVGFIERCIILGSVLWLGIVFVQLLLLL
jgi:hypothetical protein